ncbi:MAG: hypothetical protein Q9162_002274 [Coniocarpon cinnabarinum]
MPNFKDEHIVIIAPGSQTTLAQLGLPESYTPARLRLKSRMFPAEKPGQWEPNKIRSRRRANNPQQQPNGANTHGDEAADEATKSVEAGNDEPVLEEDPESDKGAVWPIEQGRVTNWPCFFALMDHCFRSLGGSFHMPIMLIAQPAWSAADHTRITRFFFETFKCPAFALMDSAQAACYAFGVSTACVIDIGKDKADVSAVTDFLAHQQSRAIAVSDCGGEAMTQHLLRQLKSSGFDREMCEQLKVSNICEILPPGVPIPGSATNGQTQQQTNGATNSNPAAATSSGSNNVAPKPDAKTKAVPENGNVTEQAIANEDENEGVLDVATIVTGGNMNEILEKKEQERAEKQTTRKKGANTTAEPPKPVRLKNSERDANTFVFYDRASREAIKDAEATGSGSVTIPGAKTSEQQQNMGISGDSHEAVSSPVEANATSPQQTSPTNTSFPLSGSLRHPFARTITVGPARFRPLPPEFLSLLTSAIHRVIEAVPLASQRTSLWDSLLIIGAGSRVRGFHDTLVDALSSRYIISPSSATMFTSEIPSNFSTPGGTGANTPQPQAAMPQGYHTAMGNRSLLQAATTASAAQFNRPPNGVPGQFPPGQHPLPPAPPYAQQPSTPGQNSQYVSTPGQISTPIPRQQYGSAMGGSHSQTPTSIKSGKLPEYFAEWREPGSESEAVFLGAQVASKVFFLNDVHVSVRSTAEHLTEANGFAGRSFQGVYESK